MQIIQSPLLNRSLVQWTSLVGVLSKFQIVDLQVKSLNLTARMASKVAGGLLKASTGLTGLNVAQNPHHMLTVLYGKTLRALQKMPQNAAYRKYTEEIINKRFDLVKQEKNVFELEKKIGCGQIEEVIVQAENELLLSRKMLEWKPWEPLQTTPPATQWKWPM